MKSTIKFHMRRLLCLAVAVGHLKMTDDELVYNSHLAVDFLVSVLRKDWQNAQALSIESTMGRPKHLYYMAQLTKPYCYHLKKRDTFGKSKDIVL